MTENPQPTAGRVQANGISLSYFEWRADLRGQEPTLLMVHATGFHGRVWDQAIAHLPGRHIVCVEQRGHGRSDSSEITDWPVFGRDLAAFAAALDLQAAVGIGHSMGAHATVQAAAIEPGRFARLILVDPVIASPAAYHEPPLFEGRMHPAAKRLNRFASAEAMRQRFADRAPYSVFHPAALRDYCEHGLVPASDGEGLMLACSPITEASVYMTGRSNAGVYASVRALQIPVLVIRAKLPQPDRNPFDFSTSPTWPGLVGEFHHGREHYLPDRTHFLPMEAPQEFAAMVLDELRIAPGTR